METTNHQPPEHSRPLARFSDALTEIENYYKHDDPQNITMGYFAEATRQALDLPYFYQLIKNMYEHNPEIEPAYVYNKLLRSFQEDALRHYPYYPEDFDSAASWSQYFETVGQNPERQKTIRYNALEREVQSNIAERYKSVHMLAAVLGDRFDHPPHHLDVGSSVLHGDIKLAYSGLFRDLRFGDIEIMEDSQEKPIPSQYLSELAHRALQSEVEFGVIAGIDITNIDADSTREWIKACSFYPDELRDDVRVNEYDLLDHIDRDHERIKFFQGDFSSNHDVRNFRDQSSVDQYDIITFSTIFYQVSRAQQTSMIVNALNLLSPQGVIITQDAPDGNFAKKYNYLTSVIDATDSHLDNQTVLRWESGRCKRARIEMGRLGRLGMRLTLIELLEQYST